MAETVAAVSTPYGEGGIGIVRLSGDRAAEIADRVFRSVSGQTIADLPGYSALYGAVFDRNEKIDEAIALRFRAPKSYTGEDVVELSCHGGNYVVKRLLRAVLSAGAEPAGPGEFTKRAFLNGKMDLSSAESVADIITASNDRALRRAVKDRDGSVYRAVTNIKQRLTHCSARIAAYSDEPDEDENFSGIELLPGELRSIFDDLSKLVTDYDNGKICKAGIDTVIVGKPNAGKSTLMNLLSRRQRSIVSDTAGTTRDIIEDSVTLGELKLCLADTAGLREADSEVESAGVERAKERAATADLLLAVLDAPSGITSEDEAVLSLCEGKKCIVLPNKTDIGNAVNTKALETRGFTVIEISAKTGEGCERLEPAIQALFSTDNIDENSVILASERQRECILKAKAATYEAIEALNRGITCDAVGVLIDDATASLAELTGESVTDAVTDEVFRSFCVGK